MYTCSCVCVCVISRVISRAILRVINRDIRIHNPSFIQRSSHFLSFYLSFSLSFSLCACVCLFLQSRDDSPLRNRDSTRVLSLSLSLSLSFSPSLFLSPSLLRSYLPLPLLSSHPFHSRIHACVCVYVYGVLHPLTHPQSSLSVESDDGIAGEEAHTAQGNGAGRDLCVCLNEKGGGVGTQLHSLRLACIGLTCFLHCACVCADRKRRSVFYKGKESIKSIFHRGTLSLPLLTPPFFSYTHYLPSLSLTHTHIIHTHTYTHIHTHTNLQMVTSPVKTPSTASKATTATSAPSIQTPPPPLPPPLPLSLSPPPLPLSFPLSFPLSLPPLLPPPLTSSHRSLLSSLSCRMCTRITAEMCRR